jgi:hypothetical protein
MRGREDAASAVAAEFSSVLFAGFSAFITASPTAAHFVRTRPAASSSSGNEEGASIELVVRSICEESETGPSD